MSWMDKGFWVAAGGLAGLVLGGMLFDDDDLHSTRRSCRSAGSNQESTMGNKAEADSTRMTMDNDFGDETTNERAQNIKEAMERIGVSLDETLESLKLPVDENTLA